MPTGDNMPHKLGVARRARKRTQVNPCLVSAISYLIGGCSLVYRLVNYISRLYAVTLTHIFVIFHVLVLNLFGLNLDKAESDALQ